VLCVGSLGGSFNFVVGGGMGQLRLDFVQASRSGFFFSGSERKKRGPHYPAAAGHPAHAARTRPQWLGTGKHCPKRREGATFEANKHSVTKPSSLRGSLHGYMARLHRSNKWDETTRAAAAVELACTAPKLYMTSEV
jgi:hypothetical protein